MNMIIENGNQEFGKVYSTETDKKLKLHLLNSPIPSIHDENCLKFIERVIISIEKVKSHNHKVKMKLYWLNS